MKASLLTAVVLLAPACRTTETRVTSGVTEAVVRIGKRAKVWDVHCEGELLGHVVLFQEQGLVRDSVYVVRNPWSQDLGIIDGLGRAYRYVPHEEQPAWVGSGTVADGAQRILGAHGRCELVERASAEGAPSPAGQKSPSGAPPEAGLPQSR